MIWRMLPRMAKSMGLTKKNPPTNEQLTQALSETKEVLKLVEWGSHDSEHGSSCPACGEWEPGGHVNPEGKHKPTCQLSKLINKINSILEG